ncbi:hypothetical protein ASG21_10140 [Chryseobacterium sp. Leaf394]|nr:hypothetical protein ASG21_10140 [Chryseobacterium sp. Leaf394]
MCQINVLAQDIKVKSSFDYVVRSEEGDLNNDGRKDKITVEMDTVDSTRPLRLQIFLSKPNGKLALAVSSTQIIEAQYPPEKKGKYNGYQIPDFRIENGNLLMWSEIKSGNITYEFRYQKGNFELISVEKLTNNSTQGYIDENTVFTETKFNLVTGLKIEKDDTNSEKILKNNIRKKTVLIRPLPKIQDFKYSDKDRF